MEEIKEKHIQDERWRIFRTILMQSKRVLVYTPASCLNFFKFILFLYAARLTLFKLGSLINPLNQSILSKPVCYLRQSWWVLQFWGLPPAWEHCREYSEMELQRQKESSVCLQAHLSCMQAWTYSSRFRRFWQSANAGEVRRVLHSSRLKEKKTEKVSPLYYLPIIIIIID